MDEKIKVVFKFIHLLSKTLAHYQEYIFSLKNDLLLIKYVIIFITSCFYGNAVYAIVANN